MPYSDPEISSSATFRLNFLGPNGSSFACDVVVSTPLNELGNQDPVARDAALQALVNFMEASADYTVSYCQKSSSMVQNCTPDA